MNIQTTYFTEKKKIVSMPTIQAACTERQLRTQKKYDAKMDDGTAQPT